MSQRYYWLRTFFRENVGEIDELNVTRSFPPNAQQVLFLETIQVASQ